MTRRLAALASLALCGAALAPVVRPPDDDGFPLATYPMFAAPRPRELTMAFGRGVTGGAGEAEDRAAVLTRCDVTRGDR